MGFERQSVLMYEWNYHVGVWRCVYMYVTRQVVFSRSYGIVNKTLGELPFDTVYLHHSLWLHATLTQFLKFGESFYFFSSFTWHWRKKAGPRLHSSNTEKITSPVSLFLYMNYSGLFTLWTVLACAAAVSEPVHSMREEAEGDRVSRGEWRAWTWRGHTTETPSRVLIAPPDLLNPLKEVWFFFLRSRFSIIMEDLMLWKSTQTCDLGIIHKLM